METLIELFQRKLAYINVGFTRSLMEEINWSARLIGIKGPRGIWQNNATVAILIYLLCLNVKSLFKKVGQR